MKSQLLAMRTASSSFFCSEPWFLTLKMAMMGPKISSWAISALSGMSARMVGG